MSIFDAKQGLILAISRQTLRPVFAPESHTRQEGKLVGMSQTLFSPFQLRSVEFPNRIGVSSMCQYSSEDGFASDWHLVHLGSRAQGGAGLVMVEASAVMPEGRITPGDLGIWKNEHIPELQRIARFIHSQGARAGIQLAHAGRKASMSVPFGGERLLSPEEGGWQTVGPSAVAFSPA